MSVSPNEAMSKSMADNMGVWNYEYDHESESVL